MEVCHPLRIWARNKDVAVRFLLSGDVQPPLGFKGRESRHLGDRYEIQTAMYSAVISAI